MLSYFVLCILSVICKCVSGIFRDRSSLCARKGPTTKHNKAKQDFFGIIDQKALRSICTPGGMLRCFPQPSNQHWQVPLVLLPISLSPRLFTKTSKASPWWPRSKLWEKWTSPISPQQVRNLQCYSSYEWFTPQPYSKKYEAWLIFNLFSFHFTFRYGLISLVQVQVPNAGNP